MNKFDIEKFKTNCCSIGSFVGNSGILLRGNFSTYSNSNLEKMSEILETKYKSYAKYDYNFVPYESSKFNNVITYKGLNVFCLVNVLGVIDSHFGTTAYYLQITDPTIMSLVIKFYEAVIKVIEEKNNKFIKSVSEQSKNKLTKSNKTILITSPILFLNGEKFNSVLNSDSELDSDSDFEFESKTKKMNFIEQFRKSGLILKKCVSVDKTVYDGNTAYSHPDDIDLKPNTTRLMHLSFGGYISKSRHNEMCGMTLKLM